MQYEGKAGLPVSEDRQGNRGLAGRAWTARQETPKSTGREARRLRLLCQLRDALRSRHRSRRTQEAYTVRVKRFIRFQELRHPAAIAGPEIDGFLTHLAVKDEVSASTQDQVLSTLHFLYRHVIGRTTGDLGDVNRETRAWTYS